MPSTTVIGPQVAACPVVVSPLVLSTTTELLLAKPWLVAVAVTTLSVVPAAAAVTEPLVFAGSTVPGLYVKVVSVPVQLGQEILNVPL